MQSLTHHDIFDTLTLNSFGWGGDPEQAARLRISKYGWYNFSGSYQHMQNYFDYDLLANPLNPAAGASPFIPILTSPHSFYDRQNLYNFDLVILPMHRSLVSHGLQPQPHHRTVIQQRSSRYRVAQQRKLGQYAERLSFWRRLSRQQEDHPELYAVAAVLRRRTDLFPESHSTPGLCPTAASYLRTSVVQQWKPMQRATERMELPIRCAMAISITASTQHVNTSIPTEQVNLKSSSLKWLDFNGQYEYSHASSSTPLGETFLRADHQKQHSWLQHAGQFVDVTVELVVGRRFRDDSYQ